MGFMDNAMEKAKNQIAASKEQVTQRAICEKDNSLSLSVIHGFKELGLPQNCIIRQKVGGDTYFGYNEAQLYRLVGYEWNGSEYSNVTTANTYGNSQINSTKKGKSGKMITGAIIGTLLFPGVGTAVGAAIGASGKTKSRSNTVNHSNRQQVIENQEKNTTAILRLSDPSGNIFSLNIICNKTTDALIRCFVIDSKKAVADVSKDAADSLKGIKALKELLDIGAITQDEFDKKKQEMLGF